ncbi:phytoene/squalene synthetase [Paramagnetospirillum caucaseum]|uniref:Phytoene/squalene synthetase n=1 Tax=Paramagnetospirillum caucaseum TaxID=1244869 RepID=M2ZTT9_9PROT|nr:squalene/phytoene synthase family protein [Paramagnetospirillum caucaseum]EME70792.1 phytoene/squalene synthetase [Paramagnetospirillum caucaseum]
MSAPTVPSTALSHAAALVSRFDRDRFVTALFAPPEKREALMLLYAFNVEIAKVQESVREPMAGQIRLQWWRDALIAGAGGGVCDNHPVARPLGELIRDRALPLEPFDDLISARQDDLDGVSPADLAEAERYAERSSAALTHLALAALGAEDGESRRAGRHVGTAWGLVGSLRALGHHLSIGKLTLPEALLRAAGTSGDAVRAGRASTDALTQVARIMAEQARHHLAEARRARPGRGGLAALLPAVLADGDLQVLEKSGWNPLDSRVLRPRSRPVRLVIAHLTGRF